MEIQYNPDLPFNTDIRDNLSCVDKYDLQNYICVWLVNDTDVWYAKTIPESVRGYKVVSRIEMPTNNFDIVFVSYDETNCEENWLHLKEKKPNSKRIHGVTGILNAYKAAALLSKTDLFYIVDGDAWIVDDFSFEDEIDIFQHKYTHLWNSKNPVNGLVYGYGGVKLFNRKQILDKKEWSTDFTTSFAGLVMHERVSNETRYNVTPYETWKSAFRECAKLSSGIMYGNDSLKRLQIWKTVGDEWSIKGASDGEKFGLENYNKQNMNKINDFFWLKQQFEKIK